MLTQKQALLALCQMFVEAVKAGGSMGAPAGVMYAAVMDKMTLAQFEQVMSVLVGAGKVRKSGHLYHFVADL